MKLSAVIFDMDGVLIDTEPLWSVSMLEVANSYGLNMDIEKMKYTTGLKINEVTQFWKDMYGWTHRISPADLSEEIVDHIIDNAKQNASVIDGITENLAYLKGQNIPIGVATSSPNRMMYGLIDHFGITEYFDVMISAEYMNYGKPHPEVYLHALDKLSATPRSSIAIEDSVNGVIAAKAARMKVIALPEYAKLHAKEFSIADMVISKMPKDDYAMYDELINR